MQPALQPATETIVAGFNRPNFAKRDTPEQKAFTGLVTAIAQDSKTGEVLIVGSANEEALRKTLSTGLATFFTTSRGGGKLWTKGEESGNYLKVVDILTNCDGSAIIYKVEPQGDGVACHAGARSCFFRGLAVGRVMMPVKTMGAKEHLDYVEYVVDEELAMRLRGIIPR